MSMCEVNVYGGVNGNVLQGDLCHTQVYCTQSPCPYSSPRLTLTSTGDTQTQFWNSLCGVSGIWCTQGFFCALPASLAGTEFDSKHDFVPPTILLGLLLCPWMWGIFFLVGSNIFLLMVVQPWVVILELLQEKMSAHLSTPPSCVKSFYSAICITAVASTSLPICLVTLL